MKVTVIPITPAQVHTVRNMVKTLENKGHQVQVIARDHGCACQLLDAYGIRYSLCGKSGRSAHLKYLEALPQLLRALRLAWKFGPDILFGTAPASFISLVLRKPCIVLNDTDIKTIQNPLCSRNPFVKVIFTPVLFNLDLGKKQFRCRMYKELAYLHPNNFQPDPSIYDLLGISRDERYVVLRFNAFDAVHDIGLAGFSVENKRRLVRELREYVHVFISSEGSLSDDLQSYAMKIPPHRIHDALYYAQMLVTDAQTMTTEAAVLGTPVVHCHPLVGRQDFGNFTELEQYGLACHYGVKDQGKAIEKALELVQQPNLKQEYQRRREKLLADKIDFTAFLVSFFENYPESLDEIRRLQWQGEYGKGKSQSLGKGYLAKKE